jgi:hypothetical protein
MPWRGAAESAASARRARSRAATSASGTASSRHSAVAAEGEGSASERRHVLAEMERRCARDRALEPRDAAAAGAALCLQRRARRRLRRRCVWNARDGACHVMNHFAALTCSSADRERDAASLITWMKESKGRSEDGPKGEEGGTSKRASSSAGAAACLSREKGCSAPRPCTSQRRLQQLCPLLHSTLSCPDGSLVRTPAGVQRTSAAAASARPSAVGAHARRACTSAARRRTAATVAAAVGCGAGGTQRTQGGRDTAGGRTRGEAVLCCLCE